MVTTVNERLTDEFIRHQHYVERFKESEKDAVLVFLNELKDEVSAVLGKKGADVIGQGVANMKQLNALLKDVAEISDQISDDMQKATEQQMRDLAIYEGSWAINTIKASLPVALDLTTIAPTQLWAAVTSKPFEGRDLTEWFSDYSTAQRKRLNQSIRMSVVNGETVDQAIRRVRGTARLGYKDGVVMGIQRRSAEALVRTGINHVVTTAREATYEENSEVIQGVMWRSTLDGRTSEICIARDGKIFPVGQGPRPPAHPNCRSTTVPVLKSWKQLGINLNEAPEGTRASMKGQVPESETYASWLKRQTPEFQDNVLGKKRAQLYRSGKLDVDQFVNLKTGQTYTLDQLKAQHPETF